MEPSACPDEEQLTRLADGVLPPEEAAALGAHTETCNSCRRLVGLLVKLKSGKPSLSTTLPSADTGNAKAIPLGTELGRYVTKRFVGAGAMGVVFEAEDPALQRRVAIKVMRSARSATAQELLKREAQVMAQLSHRNVATVFDVGVVDERSWVAMEFIEGPTLRSWLQSEPRSEQAILARILEAGSGLAAAHKAGVIHRDFKPDNVLVETSSARVVVTDFGLSFGSGETSQATPSGSIVGTPAYMAPEQRLGNADAASDQFAFCISVVEAFAGRRPFDTGRLDAQVLAQVPRRIRPALARGLSIDPKDRWPSLEALLTALTPPRRERQVLAAAAALSVVAVGAVGTNAYRRAHVCDGAGTAVQSVWNAEARANFHAAFLSTGLPFARVAADGLATELDSWSTQWSKTASEICETTEVAHTQSGELGDLRRECLDDRLRELKAVTAALTHADAKMVKSATSIGRQLPSLSDCDDEKALRAPVRLPASPELAAKVSVVRESLAAASALRVTSQFKEATAAMPALEAAAMAAGHRPLEAEVMVQAGLLSSELGDYAAAQTKLQSALVAAQAGGHALAAAQAWIGLTLVEGVKLGHPAQGHQAAQLAAAASERLGHPETLEAQLATNLGTLYSSEGKHPEAKAAYDAALNHYRTLGTDTLQLAQAINAVAAEEKDLGKPDDALIHHQEALKLVTDRYSAAHPDVAPILKNIGNVHLEAGRFDEAMKFYNQTLEVQRAAFGADSLEVASTGSNVGGTLLRQGKFTEAEPFLRGSLKIATDKLGEDNPARLAPLNNLAVLLRYTGKLEEAESSLRDALKVMQKAYGPVHEEIATTLINLGDVQLARKDFNASVKSYEDAIVITEKTSGPEHANLADCWGGLAFPLMELKDWKRALDATEKAQAIYAKSKGQPYPEGLVHFAHARALWEVAPTRRKEAKDEAAAARVALEKVGAQPEELAEIDTWLRR